MMRRSSISEIDQLYQPKFNSVEDYELWTRLSDRLVFNNLSDKLLLYRKKERSTEYDTNQKKLAFEVSKTQVEKIFQKEVCENRLLNMRQLATRSDNINNKLRAVDDILYMFDLFLDRHSDDMGNQEKMDLIQDMSKRLLADILSTPIQLTDIYSIKQLLKSNKMLPVQILQLAISHTSGIIKRRYSHMYEDGL
jgi:hypothetical protein